MTLEATAWLRILRAEPAATRSLVCFPPGGGSASAYRELANELAPGTTVAAVQYPGRQDRFGEPRVQSIAAMADAVAEDLIRLPIEPGVALFGHSMGATVAFETARRLSAAGRGPTVLIVSGRPDPRYVEPGALHEAPDAALLADLERLADDPASVAVLRDDPGLAELVLPAVRADYRAVETYRYQPGEPLRCPIVALVSDADPTTTPEQADAWREHTSGPFERIVFPGGHFYLDAAVAEVAAAISARLR
ncbi:thioesterase II family protein [Nocardia harenae]|uniref:thioesterase II family protein n=1 Tax=Nocardia harenae TaxID=358707 RepID=UPI000833A5C3|nr:alpha/beta fold hydrolase [Nocardia harenae]